MAMLAEKKRRTKWCLNPMGNDWAKDENKFGQKMLEKMGWSPGSGLGARGQGPTDIIKISVKNDTLGLGSKHENQKEIWTKTLVNYDSLLAQLNGVSNPEEREPQTLQSLEEKSRSSRARVHYHKFTRGKDVSKYSSKDLSCILPLHTVAEGEEDSASVHNNMYAYFGKKEKNPYKTLDYDETEIEPQYETTDYRMEFHECEEVKKESDQQENEDCIVRKKKKNKKHKNLEGEDCLRSIENGDNTNDILVYNSDEKHSDMQENEGNVEIKKKKAKKSKNKHLEKVDTLETVESCENENTNINDGEYNVEIEENEEPVKKKSKKNKRKYLEVNNLDTEENHLDIQENTDGVLKKKKSKKNKSKHLEEIHTSEEIETVNFNNEEKNDMSKLSSTDIIPRKKKKDKFKTG